ncbi:MAG: hypothetical protein JWP03_4131 [Phycisphaerales bacterium]|nr:hypothetical protein [Phycisphaerales bacterium]
MRRIFPLPGRQERESTGGRHHGGTGRGRRAAFTLVELLVVIGIISVLVAMLMPALGMVREAAKTTKCLSNLHQIAMGIQMYAGDHHDCLVPGDYWSPLEVRGSWKATPSCGSWAVILAEYHYLPNPTGISHSITDPELWTDDTFDRDNVLRCPSGSDDDMSALGWPTTQTDARGAQWTTRRDDFSLVGARTWYAVNGAYFQDTQASNRKLPFQWFPDGDPYNNNPDYSTHRLSQFKNSSRLPMVFDGFWMFQYNTAFINARHNRGKATNVLMADGHAEARPTDTLPDADWYLK